MLIKYDRPNVHVIGYPVGAKNQAYSSIKLKPGLNEVDSKEWDKVKTDPEVLTFLEEEILVVLSEEDKPVEKILPNLKDRKTKDAVDLIKNTMDPKLLEKWSKGEKRAGVLRAIDSQLSALHTEEAKGQKAS